MFDSVQPHRWQPTRLPRPWDSPGKNTGVGCHFFLQCMKVKSESDVAQSCPTLYDPMDWCLPCSSSHGIFQARILEWVAIAFSIALTRQTFVGKVMSLLFNMLSRLLIAFLPRNKHLLISWLRSPSALILEPPLLPNKVCHCFHCLPIYLPWSDGTRCHDVSFLNINFKPTSLSSFIFIKRLFSSSLSAIRVVSSAYLRLLIFLQQSWFQLVLHPARHF